jgi:hypothetical protein
MTAHTVIISYEIYKLVTENVLEIAKSILLYTVPMVQKRTKFIKKNISTQNAYDNAVVLECIIKQSYCAAMLRIRTNLDQILIRLFKSSGNFVPTFSNQK